MKFGHKLMYLDYLHELAQHLQLDQLIIPPAVRKLVLFSLSIKSIHIHIAPYVTSKSEARVGRVFTLTICDVKQFCLPAVWGFVSLGSTHCDRVFLF